MKILADDLDGLCSGRLSCILNVLSRYIATPDWTFNELSFLRSVVVDGVRRQVRFFGIKGDLKWRSQVFKLSATQRFYLHVLRVALCASSKHEHLLDHLVLAIGREMELLKGTGPRGAYIPESMQH